MGRKNRRRKIAAIFRKAKERRKLEAQTLADPQTVAGQSLCTVEDFNNHEVDLEVVRSMKEEEVIVDCEDTEKEAPASWFSSLLSYFW